MRVLAIFGGFVLVLIVGVVAFFALIPRGSDVDCDTVSLPTAQEWQGLDAPGKQSEATRLLRCETLAGASREEVREAFGTLATDTDSELVVEVSRGEFVGGEERPPDLIVMQMDGDTVAEAERVRRSAGR